MVLINPDSNYNNLRFELGLIIQNVQRDLLQSNTKIAWVDPVAITMTSHMGFRSIMGWSWMKQVENSYLVDLDI